MKTTIEKQLALSLPTGVGPERIVSLSAVIYSDPDGSGNVVAYNFDRLKTYPKVVANFPEASMGGNIMIRKVSGIYKIYLNRGPDAQSFFASANPVTDENMPVAYTGTSNRGYCRLEYLP